MTTKFLRNADDFQVVNSKSLNVHDVLPPGNYVIQKTPENVLYLHRVEDFQHPNKIYGDNNKIAQRILDTFKARPAGTGVLLSGEKGSGKTLLARTVCINAASEGVPTIIINASWHGDTFFAFLAAITQPCIILFDEFEKIYDTKKNEQDHILTLLDGVFASKKLFILTCNDRFGINTNMINRPGRIFYAKEFGGLDEAFIREYSENNLNDRTQMDSIVRITNLFSEFNFDMLKALIEEMNRYNESTSDALALLNVSPAYDYAKYKVNILLGSGEAVVNEHTSPSEIKNPLGLKDGLGFRVYTRSTEKESDDSDDDGMPLKSQNIRFYPSDVISADGEKMVMRNKNGDVLNLTKEKFTDYNWRGMANAI